MSLIAIVGSRDFQSLELVDAYVETLPRGTVVLTGGARGVDQRAEKAARVRGLATQVFRADWQRYGRQAGFRRNAEMVASADQVTAFWDGSSRGTKHSIELAREANKLHQLFMDTRSAL